MYEIMFWRKTKTLNCNHTDQVIAQLVHFCLVMSVHLRIVLQLEIKKIMKKQQQREIQQGSSVTSSPMWLQATKAKQYSSEV